MSTPRWTGGPQAHYNHPCQIAVPDPPEVGPCLRSPLVFDKVLDNDTTIEFTWNPSPTIGQAYMINGPWDDEYIVPDAKVEIGPMANGGLVIQNCWYSMDPAGGNVMYVTMQQQWGKALIGQAVTQAFVQMEAVATTAAFNLAEIQKAWAKMAEESPSPAYDAAIGTALTAGGIGYARRAKEMLSLLSDRAREMPLKCPVCNSQQNVEYLVVHLNDIHQWTREAIADHLDDLEEQGVVDLTIHFKEEEPA